MPKTKRKSNRTPPSQGKKTVDYTTLFLYVWHDLFNPSAEDFTAFMEKLDKTCDMLNEGRLTYNDMRKVLADEYNTQIQHEKEDSHVPDS